MGKPRMTRSDRWKQRDCVVKYRNWADHARLCVRQQLGSLPPTGKILALHWIAYFKPPESWSKKKREAANGQLHRSRPDRDNIDKAVLDALFDEDSGIADGQITKRWDNNPRLAIRIEVEENECQASFPRLAS